jgi:cytoplasmic iron level regulating protein YaaA (DUF328/UPF0246 family)
MLLLLSPSKTLDEKTPVAIKYYTQPHFLSDSEVLITKLRSLSQQQIADMMELSDKLARLNMQRFADFHTPFTPQNARQALLAFKGDVYTSIEVDAYKAKDFAFAQEHVRILSGLYGVLRPLDLLQPYRLEMGRKLTVGKTKDLYGFWGTRVTELLNDELATNTSKLLINLASEEYSKVISRKTLKYPIIDVVFKEKQGDKLKIIGLFAKQARGAMANFVIKNRLDTAESLKYFAGRGYKFQSALSTASQYVFVRKAS